MIELIEVDKTKYHQLISDIEQLEKWKEYSSETIFRYEKLMRDYREDICVLEEENKIFKKALKEISELDYGNVATAKNITGEALEKAKAVE